MKKRISALLTALFLAAALCTSALAAGGSMDYVYDLSGLLAYDDWEMLEAQAADIAQRTGCGVYIVAVDDYADYGEGSVYDVAAQIFNIADNGFGVGADRDGILLLLSMYGGDWAMFVHGEGAEYAFNDYGQAALEDSFLPALGESDWYGGFAGYLAACDEYLTLASAGAPVRASVVKSILPVVGISCAVSLVICLILKGKMKTVRRKAQAQAYVSFGGLNLTERYDRYTHTTESRSQVENTSKSESGGGGSGRSGKF